MLRDIRFKTAIYATKNNNPKAEIVGYNNHLVDHGGNHFIEGVCFNPLEPKFADEEDLPIGSTIPPVEDRIPWIEVTYRATEEEREAIIQEERAKQYKRENRE